MIDRKYLQKGGFNLKRTGNRNSKLRNPRCGVPIPRIRFLILAKVQHLRKDQFILCKTKPKCL